MTGRGPEPGALVLAPRRERIEQVLEGRTRNLVVVLDRLEDSFNMAAVLRTCEAFGIQEVHVIENADVAFRPNSKVTQGCDKWLDIARHKDARECVVSLQSAGYAVLASAAGRASTSLFELCFAGKKALVFGNERHGVSNEVRAQADGAFWIPMLGFSQSLNISAAVSASLTHAVGWRLSHLHAHGDLLPDQRAALTERFRLLSVKQRGRIYRRPADPGI